MLCVSIVIYLVKLEFRVLSIFLFSEQFVHIILSITYISRTYVTRRAKTLEKVVKTSCTK